MFPIKEHRNMLLYDHPIEMTWYGVLKNILISINIKYDWKRESILLLLSLIYHKAIHYLSIKFSNVLSTDLMK